MKIGTELDQIFRKDISFLSRYSHEIGTYEGETVISNRDNALISKRILEYVFYLCI